MEQGLASADQKLSQTYTVRYIAHAPLEPRAAVAQWDGDQVTVWMSTQRPFGTRTEIAKAFRLPEDKVRVIVPDVQPLAMAASTPASTASKRPAWRAPRKSPSSSIWTRAEEFQWAYFRPAGVIDMQSGVSARRHAHCLGISQLQFRAMPDSTRPYEVPNRKHPEFHATDSPLRQGSYRGLAATANHFARESHMDDLAATCVKMDPARVSHEESKRRAPAAPFSKPPPKSLRLARREESADAQGFRLGLRRLEKGGYVATCAEVRVNRASGAVRVARVVTAYECGAVVNPECLSNQIEGAVMYGLGGALFEQIDFADGRVRNGHFAQYRLPRFSDLPEIQAVLVNRKDLEPAGAGEVPMFALAPAIGNAIFDATGVRLRALPLVPQGLKV